MKVFDLTGFWDAYLTEKTQVVVPGCFDKYMQAKDFAEPVYFTRNVLLKKQIGYAYQLCCGAVSYFCKVKVNGVEAGEHEGMWDSFRFDITDLLYEGDNKIEFWITKPGYYDTDAFPLRQVLSGFIPDVLCTFGGIWDKIWIEESANAFFDCHYAKGSQDGKFSVVLGVNQVVDGKKEAKLKLNVFSPQGISVFESEKNVVVENKDIILSGSIKNPELWYPHSPKLYKYQITVNFANESVSLKKAFGFRTVRAKGTSFVINDTPVYLRGALHWGYYDKEFVPNPTCETVDNELKGITEYGFNAVKHCLYIPRNTYLNAGDEKGVLQWIELPLWLPEPSPYLSDRIKREYPRIIRQIAGHPSVVLTTLGCELDDKVDGAVLKEMYNLLKSETDTLVNDNSGSSECYGGLKVDYSDYFDYHFYADLQNFENLLENFTPGWRNTKPWFFGEFCDSDVMRNLFEVRKENKTERLMWESGDKKQNPICVLKPDFYAHHHDERICESGILNRFEQVRELSVQHSLVHRKITLELTRAEPVVSGYNITSLRDVPLCANGMFDDMGNARFNTRLFKQSNNDDVLCPSWDLSRIWLSADRVQPQERFNFVSGGDYGLHILLSHYSFGNIDINEVDYTLSEDGKAVMSGKEACDVSFETGDIKKLCYIRFTLPQTAEPKNFVLTVKVNSGALNICNEWPVFVYPEFSNCKKRLAVYDNADAFRTVEKIYDTHILADGEKINGDNTDAVLTVRLTPEIRAYAESGGHVVLVQRGKGSLPVRHCSFWREGMLWREADGFLNSLPRLNPYDDLRFYSVGCETAFCPKETSDNGFSDYRAILRRYDCREWLAHDYIASMKLGKGTIAATTLRLDGGMGKQPLLLENNCFGKWLLTQMLEA